MGREDKTAWKSNYFTKLVVSIKLKSGSFFYLHFFIIYCMLLGVLILRYWCVKVDIQDFALPYWALHSTVGLEVGFSSVNFT
jgi:hypothetical protein